MEQLKPNRVHDAARNGNYKELENLLRDPENLADVSMLTDVGETAVLLAVRSACGKKPIAEEDCALKCVKLLAESNCNLHVRDNFSDNYTAMHLAAVWKLWLIVEFLLDQNVNVDIEIRSTTARKLIAEHDPNLVAKYVGSKESGQDFREPLVTAMWSVDMSHEEKELFCEQWLEENSNLLLVNDPYKGGKTLLEHAVTHKLIGVVKKLVSMKGCNSYLGLIGAVEAGYEVFSALTSQKEHKVKGVTPGPTKQTLLHRALDSPNADVKLVESLLGMAKEQMSEEDFEQWRDAKDFLGFTALHYATKRQIKDVPILLLNEGANMFVTDNCDMPAFCWMQPDELENFLDSRISLTDLPWHNKKYALVIDYNFIQKAPTDNDSMHCTNVTYSTSTDDAEIGMIDSGEENSDAKWVLPDSESMSLCRLATSPIHKHLLKHPAIKSFLCLKWHRLYWLFWVNFIFYIFFVASFTTYLLSSIDRRYNTNNTNNSSSQEQQAAGWVMSEGCIDLLRVMTIILTFLLALRELWQIFFQRAIYFTRWENWLELTLVNLMFIHLFMDTQTKTLSAFLYLLVSLEMVLLMGRHPGLATYVIMFIRVSVDLIKLLLWFASLIIAFSVSFYIMFHKCDEGDDCDNNFFRTIPTSIFKTMVMLFGEYNASEIKFDRLSIYSHIIFLAFLFFMAIVLMNLLNGLAVSDTQEIKNEAEIIFCVSQATFFADIERSLLVHCEAQNCFNFAKECAQWIERKILLLGNLLPENKVTVYLNMDNAVEPDVRLCKTDCFLFCCCPSVVLLYLAREMFSMFNEIVKEALHIAKKLPVQQVSNLDLVLARIDELKQELKFELNSGSRKRK